MPRIVRLAISGALAVALAVVAVVNDVPGRIQDRMYVYAATTVADPTDGPALVHEAIANVRGMKRFRFTQTIGGANAGKDAGTASGEVQLSSGAGKPPKLRTKTELHNLQGSVVHLEVVTVGDEMRSKGPGAAAFQKLDRKPAKITGRSAGEGRGVGSVDVIDPVMMLLEPIDRLPDASFGAPSAQDAKGLRSVTVTLGDASFIIRIDDAQHLVRAIDYTRGGRTASFTLDGFGDITIDISLPSTG